MTENTQFRTVLLDEQRGQGLYHQLCRITGQMLFLGDFTGSMTSCCMKRALRHNTSHLAEGNWSEPSKSKICGWVSQSVWGVITYYYRVGGSNKNIYFSEFCKLGSLSSRAGRLGAWLEIFLACRWLFFCCTL